MEIIRLLNSNPQTKLLVIAEPYGYYGIQDDTAVPLDLDYKLVDLFDKVWVKPLPLDVENELMVPIAEEVFDMSGLVVLNLLPIGNVFSNMLPKVLEQYYFQHVGVNCHEKIHLIHILPSE